MTISTLVRGVVAVAASAACGVTFAQVAPAPTEFSIEGKIGKHQSGAVVDTAGNIECNGSIINIASAVITSPTHRLQINDLNNTLKFPGREHLAYDGVEDGTCIIDGFVEGGIHRATTAYIEVAENVLVGPAKGYPAPQSGEPNQPFAFSILDVPVLLLAKPGSAPDPRSGIEESGNRIVGATARNGYGFEVDLSTVEDGDLSAAEGYVGKIGERKVLFAHDIETSGGAPLAGSAINAKGATITRANATLRNVTINRQAMTEVRLETRGACIASPDGTILSAGAKPLSMELTGSNNLKYAVRFGTAGTTFPCVQEAAPDGYYGIYDQRPLINIPRGVRPVSVRVFDANGTSVQAPIVIR